MKTIILFLVTALFCLLGCTDTQKLDIDDFARQQVKPSPEELKTMLPVQSALIHAVYFNLKEDISEEDSQRFLSELKRLSAVSSADYVNVGTPADSSDPRMDKNFDMVLQVGFADLEALAKYQADTLHLNVKKNVGGLLAGPPVVYDFFTN